MPPSWLLPLLPRRGPGGGGQGGGGRDSGWHHDASRLPVSVQLSPARASGHFHLQVASDDRLGPLYNNSLSIQDLQPARPRRVGYPEAGRRRSGHRAPPPPAAA